jgi:hypothetical protein
MTKTQMIHDRLASGTGGWLTIINSTDNDPPTEAFDRVIGHIS